MLADCARASFVTPLFLPTSAGPSLLTRLRPPRVLLFPSRAARRRLSPSVMTPSATTTPAPLEAVEGRAQARVAADVVIMIHGITIDADPGSETENRLKKYEDLHNKVLDSMKGTPKHDQWAKSTLIGVQWGFQSVDFDGEPLRGDHTLLAAAERFSVMRTNMIEEENFGFTLNPLKMITRSIRTPLRYGLSDMFFYVSRSGRPLVRRAVARQIMNTTVLELVKKGEPIDLTILGHSAGSVVAHDFCFFLQDAKGKMDAAGELSEEGEKAIQSFAEGDPSLVEDLKLLVEHARQGKLKIRKLVTFGCPLHIMFIRSEPVLRSFAAEKGVDPAIYGLKESAEGSSNPRWINVVEADDIIAGPVVGLIDENSNTVGEEQVVEDIYLNITGKILKAHGSYWGSEKFSQTIADKW